MWPSDFGTAGEIYENRVKPCDSGKKMTFSLGLAKVGPRVKATRCPQDSVVVFRLTLLYRKAAHLNRCRDRCGGGKTVVIPNMFWFVDVEYDITLVMLSIVAQATLEANTT